MFKTPPKTRLSHYLRTGQKVDGFQPDSYKSTDLCDLCGGMVYDLDLKGIRSERNARYQILLKRHKAEKLTGKTHKIWQVSGGPKTRKSHVNANAQKVGIDEKFRVGNEKLFLPNDPKASLSETANCRCFVKYVPEIAQSNLVKHYSLKPGVTLPAAIEQQVSLIADRYFQATGEDIIITSGRRSFLRQAEVMYDNRISRGRFGNFKAKRMIAILEDIFKQG